MAAHRAKLFAAFFAVGSCAPLIAQTPDAPINVEAPRAVVQPPPSALSVLPDPVQSAGFRISGTPTTTSSGSSAWLAPPGNAGGPSDPAPAAAPNPPVSNVPMQPVAPYMPQYPIMHPTGIAPAWRWHGYGAVTPSPDIQPVVQSVAEPQKPATPMPSAVTLPAQPTVPAVNLGGEIRPTIVAPTDSAPTPLPPALPPQPLSAADPTWRPAIQQTACAGVNPMTAGPPPWQTNYAQAPGGMEGTACTSEWRGPAVTLDMPRPAGTYVARAVCETVGVPVTAIQQASYSTPATPAKTPLTLALPAIRASIERASVGRGRGLELVPKGPSSLLVRLKVWQSSDAEYLANVISRLPDLGPYQVLYEIQVAR